MRTEATTSRIAWLDAVASFWLSSNEAWVALGMTRCTLLVDSRARSSCLDSHAASLLPAVLAAPGVTATVWLLVAGYAGHGLKDFWQERRQYVANTRWWPPFCAAVDWFVAAVLAVEIAAGVNFH